MRPWLALTVAAGLLGGPILLAATQVRLPATLLDAAAAGALPLALALSTRGVPASVVTSEDPSAVTPVRGNSEGTATLDDVSARFRETHGDYAIAMKDGVLGIEQTGIACGRILDKLTLKSNTLQADLPRALIILAWLASGDPPPIPAGQLGQLDGGRGLGSAQPDLAPISLVIAEGMPLRSAFDAAVRSNKGGVWIVWQHRRDDGSTGCRSVGYYSNGQVGASSKDFATTTSTGSLGRGSR